MTEATAITKNIRITPIKLGFLASEVRGQSVNAAIEYLSLSPKRRMADIVSKTIRSAVANATQKGTMDIDKLVVSTILVGKATTMKRYIPRAKGAAGGLLKYSSHLTVIVSESTAKAKKVK